MGCVVISCQDKDTRVVYYTGVSMGCVVISCQDKDTGVVLLYRSVDGLCSY